jgi:hypothetical protein
MQQDLIAVGVVLAVSLILLPVLMGLMVRVIKWPLSLGQSGERGGAGDDDA